jgi:2'-5' RNA ligase
MKAEPKFVGVKFDVISQEALMDVAKCLPNPNPKSSLHITVCYSKAPIRYFARGHINPIPVTPKHYSIFSRANGDPVLVLEVDCEPLGEIHNWMRTELGASYDHEEFKPHVSLSYNIGQNFDIAVLPAPEILPTLYVNYEYGYKLKVLDPISVKV